MAPVTVRSVTTETVGVGRETLAGQPGGPSAEALVDEPATVVQRPVLVTQVGRRAP